MNQLKNFLVIWIALFFSCTAVQKVQTSKEKTPNIVFILVDDLGCSDVGYANAKSEIKTPNIDQLASEGARFMNAYAAAPVCSPTRASIMTGKYPARLKLTCHIPGMGMEKYLRKLNKGKKLKEAFFVDRLALEEQTIAEVLKEKGYKTGFLGKWHLAGEGSVLTKDGVVDAAFHPEKMGFDVNIGGCAYGMPRSYFSPYVNATITDGPTGEYLTTRMGDEAVKFVQKNAQSPFFLMLSTYTVHTPLVAPQETIDKYNGNKYYAMIEELDKNVGKVLNALEAEQIAENTIVVLYSDNGGLWGNAPFRGIKGSLFEGGIKVPMIIKWPNKIKANSEISELVSSVDILPTFAEVAGAKNALKEPLDGKSLVSLLKNQKPLDRTDIYWHFPHHRSTDGAMGAAIRSGDWKLIYFFETEKFLLFNLKNDPYEKNNLADHQPQKVKALNDKLITWQKAVDAEMPALNN